MFKLITIPGEEIIHVIPQEYTVDGEDGIQDPKGMSGVKLEANFHVITAQVGTLSKKPKQVNNWLKVLSDNFGNSKLDEVMIPSFDCRWNFASSIMNS